MAADRREAVIGPLLNTAAAARRLLLAQNASCWLANPYGAKSPNGIHLVLRAKACPNAMHLV